MMTISNKTSKTGPVEISADLLTMISGGGKDDNKMNVPKSEPSRNTRVDVVGNENIMFAYIEHKIPINDNINLILDTTADTTRGLTKGMVSLEIRY